MSAHRIVETTPNAARILRYFTHRLEGGRLRCRHLPYVVNPITPSRVIGAQSRLENACAGNGVALRWLWQPCHNLFLHSTLGWWSSNCDGVE